MNRQRRLVRDEASVKLAWEYWNLDQPYEAGRCLCEGIRLVDRPEWAADILEAVIDRTGLQAPAVQSVLDLARDSKRWIEAHDAFSVVRRENLKIERDGLASVERSLLLAQLRLTELVAKVTYNAAFPLAPFDGDSGWRIPGQVREVLGLLGDGVFSEYMWRQLIANEGRLGL